MLDGKRYYAAFPDENPERPVPRALLNALEELEVQFRKHITEFRLKAARSAPMTSKKQAERATKH